MSLLRRSMSCHSAEGYAEEFPNLALIVKKEVYVSVYMPVYRKKMDGWGSGGSGVGVYLTSPLKKQKMVATSRP